MTKTNILLAALLTFSASFANAQTAFRSLSVKNHHNSTELTFTVSREVNAYQYRVLAGSDSAHLDLVGVIAPQGNSVMPREYSYPLTLNKNAYFRVQLIGMNANTVSSPVVHAPETKAAPEHRFPAPANNQPFGPAASTLASGY